METEQNLISGIVARNAVKETHKIRDSFLNGNLSFEQARESLLSLRGMLWGVEEDLELHKISIDAEPIRDAIHEVRDMINMVDEYKTRLEFYESKLRRQLRNQLVEEQEEA